MYTAFPDSQAIHNWVAMAVTGGVPHLTGRVAQQAMLCLEQVWPQLLVRVSLAGSNNPFTVQAHNGAVCKGRVSLGTVLADRAWGALGQRDQKWVSS